VRDAGLDGYTTPWVGGEMDAFQGSPERHPGYPMCSSGTSAVGAYKPLGAKPRKPFGSLGYLFGICRWRWEAVLIFERLHLVAKVRHEKAPVALH
jgi:hypothetical protein